VSAHIFGRRFCITIDRGRSSTGKAQKFYSMANCGMRVAMDIGVIREDVMGFYRVSPSRRLRSFGCKFSCKDMGRHWVHRSERVREHWMCLPVNLAREEATA